MTGAGAAGLGRIAMFNEAHISLMGYVAGDPTFSKVGKNQVPKLVLRVCWTPRRRNSLTGEWIDGNRSFANVICWRQLAENGSICLRRGDPVVVRGRLDVRTFTGRDGQRRTIVDVEASALGPDLTRGVADFRKVWPPSGKTAEQLAAENGHGGHDAPGDDADMADVADDEAAPGAERPADDEAAPGAESPADDEAAPGAESPAGEDIFDEGAIDALEQDTQTAAAPF
jgi:single-strand DNA-binding protein